MLRYLSLTTTHLMARQKSLSAQQATEKERASTFFLRTDRRGLGTATLEGIQFAQRKGC